MHLNINSQANECCANYKDIDRVCNYLTPFIHHAIAPLLCVWDKRGKKSQVKDEK